MDNTEMFKAINKGVPNYIPIEISIDTLIHYCASDEENLKNEFTLLKGEINGGSVLIPKKAFDKNELLEILGDKE